LDSDRDVVVYTDGSRLEGRVGCGFVVRQKNCPTFRRERAMGSKATVYDAEVEALSMAMCRLSEHQTDAEAIHFASDNRAAVQSILSSKVGSAQPARLRFQKAALTWLDGREGRRITVEWIPGHRNIRGNEEADELARAGAGREPVEDEEVNTFSYQKQRAKAYAEEAWVERAALVDRDNLYADCRRPPRTKPFSRKHSLRKDVPRRSRALLTQVKTGHSFTGEYYRWAVPSEAVECPCGAALETREHILRTCPRYDAHRDVLRAASPTIHVPTLLGTDKGLRAIVEFIERTGAFTKGGRRTREEDDALRRYVPFRFS
jgi:ribonuclease HI